MTSIRSDRVVRSYTQHIQAPPERVFPLLCPVLECEWLDGWRDGLEMVHSESGVAEEGCVFRTRRPGAPETVWMITRHDPARKIVDFARVTTGLVATRLQIGVEAGSSASSRVHISYTFTPLGDAGAAFVRDNHSEAAFLRDMKWWEDSMNHWLRTGETLRAASH